MHDWFYWVILTAPINLWLTIFFATPTTTSHRFECHGSLHSKWDSAFKEGFYTRVVIVSRPHPLFTKNPSRGSWQSFSLRKYSTSGIVRMYCVSSQKNTKNEISLMQHILMTGIINSYGQSYDLSIAIHVCGLIFKVAYCMHRQTCYAKTFESFLTQAHSVPLNARQVSLCTSTGFPFL